MRISLLVTICALLVVPSLKADATYSYVGDTFGKCSGTLTVRENPFGCGGIYSISGSFTTSLDPFHLENLEDFVFPAEDITSFSFAVNGTDITLNQLNAAGRFDISTDADGHIGRSDRFNSWIVGVGNPDVLMGLAQRGGSYVQAMDGRYGQTTLSGVGAWSDSLPAPAPTPEPGTLALLGSGLLVMAMLSANRWRTQWQNSARQP